MRLFGSLIVRALPALVALAQPPDPARSFDLVVYGSAAGGVMIAVSAALTARLRSLGAVLTYDPATR